MIPFTQEVCVKDLSNMAQSKNPKTWEELFDRLYVESSQHTATAFFESYIDSRTELGRQMFPFMAGKTAKDFYKYQTDRTKKQLRPDPSQSGPTVAQFWHAAYEFNPLARHDKDLGKIIATNKLKRIPLGKLYGTRLELEPSLGALSDSYARVCNMELPRLSFPTAISYKKSHPSENEEVLVVPSDKDLHLHRFLCLGWVIEVDGQEWTRTGHVLVIDMDETPNKKRHPWFLLAAEWSDDHCMYPDNTDGTIRAEEFVEQGRTDGVEGILPGTTNRTTVARLRSRQLKDHNQSGPFLAYFHENLEFEVTRFGLPDEDERDDPHYLKGTYLPIIMEMYWDADRNEEVCYNEDKLVYFRYHRPTGRYIWIQPAATDNFTETPRQTTSAPIPVASRPRGRPTYAQHRRERNQLQRTTEA